jgi:hypothetical protein
MKRYDSRKEVTSVFATYWLKRNHLWATGDNNRNSNIFCRVREEETVATATAPLHIARIQARQQKKRRHPLCDYLNVSNLIRYFVVVAFVVVESGKMMATTRKSFSRVSMGIGNTQSTRRRSQQLHCYFPGPLKVSASTVPSIVSRFHHNQHEAGKIIPLVSASRLLDVERYRGGSQHHFRQQQRGASSNHNHNYTPRRENDRKDETVHKATTANNKNNNPLSSLFKSQHRVSKIVRQGIGGMFSLGGFLGSSFVAFATDHRSFEDRFVEPIRALSNFLKTSGVDDELSKSFNPRLGINLCLLGRVHMYQEEFDASISAQKKKKRQRGLGSNFAQTLLHDSYSPSSSSKINGSFLEEARRYMKYATAVYGQAMINAAEVDARGRLDGKVGRVTKETIGTHISVPAEDIVLMDVSNYDGDSNHLRHMVVVDHEHQKVVLSIRGTFSLEEIVKDVAAFTREFCGGEAHSEMATMAERVWKAAGPKVKTVLEENPGYEFILTGHSLGAGAACLVTILVQNKRLLPKGQKIRCFAYASPPCYTPLEFVPKSVESTTNFVSFYFLHWGENVVLLSFDACI